MADLTEGQAAPDFEGSDQDGNTIRLSDYRGKKVILYFYPKDNTPGCTAEACNLRDNHSMLAGKGFAVVGVSPDSEKTHKGFSGKYSLPFPLISDPDKKILKQYGAWGEKKIYAKLFKGVIRTTFIIDENGVIEKIIRKVNTANHTSQVLKLYEK